MIVFGVDVDIDSYFHPRFVYGVCQGASLFALMMIVANGWLANVWQGKVYAFHVIYLCIIFCVFYDRFKKEHDFSRFLTTIMTVLMVYFIHDIYATLEIARVGGIWFDVRLEPQTPTLIANLYVRNAVIVLVGLYTTRDYVRFSWKGLSLMLLQGLFWFTVWFVFPADRNPFTYMPLLDVCAMSVDFAPYLYLVNVEREVL